MPRKLPDILASFEDPLLLPHKRPWSGMQALEIMFLLMVRHTSYGIFSIARIRSDLQVAAPVTRLPSTYQPAPSPSDAECDHKTQTHPADKPPSSLPNTEKSDQGEQATPETGRDTPEQEAELYEDWERYRDEEEKKEDHGWRLGETGIMLLQQK